MNPARLLIAGTNSGAGKSTLSLGLMAALARRGMQVRPFKVGPDYIDPSLHARAAGRPSYNLDAWLAPEEALRALFFRHAGNGDRDIAVIEGVMGLFDGLGAGAYAGTAHMASLLRAPVLLVVNARGMNLSLAAQISGFAAFRPKAPAEETEAYQPDLGGLHLAGVIVNRVSGPRHAELLTRIIHEQCGLPCLGALPEKGVPALASRHLGLIPAQELPDLDRQVQLLADAVEEHCDLGTLLALARTAPQADSAAAPPEKRPGSPAHDSAPLSLSAPVSSPVPGPVPGPEPEYAGLRLGLARDRAFSFYYEDNLDFLREAGAELIFFSPLKDAALPENLHGLYLGGGFPEVFAAELEANAAFRSSLRAALESGLPAYAECGSMLYLCQSIDPAPATATDSATDPAHDAKSAPARSMTGFLPCRAQMTARLQPFGYVTIHLLRDCLLGPAGTEIRAHEFHYSRLAEDDELTDALPVLRISKPDGRAWFGGLERANTLAAYPHIMFRGCPQAALSFLARCRDFRDSFTSADSGGNLS